MPPVASGPVLRGTAAFVWPSDATLSRAGKHLRQGNRAGGSAGNGNAVDRIARQEGGARLAPGKLAPGLAEQMDGRRPAARDQHAVGIEPGAVIQRHAFDAQLAVGSGKRPPLDQSHLGGCGGHAIAPDVDERDIGAGLDERARDFVGAVIVGGDDDAVADQHRMAPEIGERRIRRQDARQVVVGERQRPLDGAGRQHDVARPDPPQRVRPAVGMALVEPDQIVVVDAEGGGRRQDQVTASGQLRNRLLDPDGRRLAVDPAGPMAKRSARLRLVVDKHDGQTRAGRQPCRRQSGRPGAHHQHVAMVIDLV